MRGVVGGGGAIVYVCSKVGCFLVSWLVVRSGRSGADGDAAMRRRLSSPTSRGLTRHWWPLLRGFGSWVWRRLVALGCLVWGLAGWGSWPRPA